ncbi:pyridine nucleotide-disulfide oxidoreductase-domain-containing protein [Mycena amicta]|nr:pyridine nucleotide-disulfide oxidoreductase-domain-containing protein [Mycena amicta]
MSTTLAVLPESELKDGQMKEVAFGAEGKADKIHATSAFCTHYGAPLAKGVLAADGRVDAPAPDALHSFSVKVSGGQIHVTADAANTLKANMARAPKARICYGRHRWTRGRSLLNGYKGPITVLTKEKHTPVDRTKLSKSLMSDVSKLEYRTASALKIQYSTNIRVGVTATSIDFDKKHVVLDDGKETVAYEKLILAPGGEPRKLPIPGADAQNVFTLRGVEDAKKIDAAAKEGKRIVMIGSSFISMEIVSTVSKRKLASIDVPFELVLGKEVGKALQKLQYHESQGVKFHMQTKIEKIVPKEDDETTAAGVVVNGETLPCDLDSGVPTERDGGVRVDEYLKLVGYEDVYAVGDIAHYPQLPTGEIRRVEHWNVAGNQGRAVGKSIAGSPQPFVKVPFFWSAQGQNIRYCGIGTGYDDIFISGNVEELKFIAYYIKGGKVVAVASMQNDPVVSVSTELLRLGLMLSPEELRAGVDPRNVDISTASSLKKL